MGKIKDTFKDFKSKYQHHTIINTIIIIAICFFQFISLDLSSIIAFSPEKIVLLWCITTFSLFFITMTLILLTRKTKLCCKIVSVLVLILSITNFLVYKYHGSPFVLSDIKNASTAFNSIGGSNFVSFIFQPRYLVFLLCFLIEMFLCNFFNKDHKFKRGKSIVLVILCGIGVYYSFFSSSPLVPMDALSSIPENTIKQFSYFPGFIRQIHLSFINPINMPSEYDEDKVTEFLKNYSIENNSNEIITDYPDIIIILNESFYNLELIKDTQPSQDYLYNYHNLDNSLSCYSAVYGIKGGTNIAEWEILTSNSYNICNSITPFNDINMLDANSIVTHLKSLGYYTIACHPQSGHNYKRDDAWEKLGFDEIHFEEDFKNLNYSGINNNPTDESLYNNVIDWMENAPHDKPKFVFCITMQNHLPFDNNSSSVNSVTCQTDFGKHQSEVEHYLSSLQSSDKAFAELTKKVNTNRNTIIAMCGDHAPSLNIYNTENNDLEYYINIRSTPLIIWSNNKTYLENFYEMPNIMNKKEISLIYLLPSILESTNMPLSKYYDYLINLRNEAPVFPYDIFYFDSLGNVHTLDEENSIKKKISDYYYLEYFNIMNANRFKEIDN